MKLEEPTLVDLLRLCSMAREDEIEQYEALIGKWNYEEAAMGFYGRSGIKFVLIDDSDNPVCAGGWEEVIPGVWQSWMVGTDYYWKKHWRSITKHSRKVMDELLNAGARRLQTGALASRSKACSWYIRGLKMKPEGICRNFGFGGEDMATFARIKEVPHG